jgi:hypothetical protein
MSLQVTDAISDGIGRTFTLTGGIAFALLLAIQFLSVASVNTVIAARFPSEVTDTLGVTLPVSGTVGSALLVATMLFTPIYFVVVARAFARPRAELSSFPAPLYTRRMGRATLSMLVGGIFVSIAVVIGSVFFFLPGIFLAACFLFFIFAVGVEDRGVLGGLKRSWGLARGNRLRLGVFVFLLGVMGAIVGIPSTVFQAAGEPLIGNLITVFANSVIFVFVYGIMAAMYLQLEDGDEPRGGARSTRHARAADV